MQDPITADALRSARQAAGLSQRELAARLGIRPVALSDWELGRAPIDLPVAKLAAACSAPPIPREPLALARRHMEWVHRDATVLRRHLDGMQKRVREAVAALEAMATTAQ